MCIAALYKFCMYCNVMSWCDFDGYDMLLILHYLYLIRRALISVKLIKEKIFSFMCVCSHCFCLYVYVMAKNSRKIFVTNVVVVQVIENTASISWSVIELGFIAIFPTPGTHGLMYMTLHFLFTYIFLYSYCIGIFVIGCWKSILLIKCQRPLAFRDVYWLFIIKHTSFYSYYVTLDFNVHNFIY